MPSDLVPFSVLAAKHLELHATVQVLRLVIAEISAERRDVPFEEALASITTREKVLHAALLQDIEDTDPALAALLDRRRLGEIEEA